MSRLEFIPYFNRFPPRGGSMTSLTPKCTVPVFGCIASLRMTTNAGSTAHVSLTCSNGVDRWFLTHGWRGKPTDESQQGKVIVYPWDCQIAMPSVGDCDSSSSPPTTMADSSIAFDREF